MQPCDFLIVGATIAGASAAHYLAPHGMVAILEAEEQPGYHTTGRSAAVFSELYGNVIIRRLSKASRSFFEDRISKAVTVGISKIERKWAGLRSFVADKTPVVGYDPEVDGFSWLAGQGGYGIQTAPSMGRVASRLVRAAALPEDLIDLGLVEAALAPDRVRSVTSARTAVGARGAAAESWQQ